MILKSTIYTEFIYYLRSINIELINRNHEKVQFDTKNNLVLQKTNSFESLPLKLQNDYIDEDDNESVLNIDLTSDIIDINTNFEIKNNLNQNFIENNIFNEIKQVYIDEQRVLFNENFDNLENFSKDCDIVQFLEIQVNKKLIILRCF
jgi:hypothetical protein